MCWSVVLTTQISDGSSTWASRALPLQIFPYNIFIIIVSSAKMRAVIFTVRMSGAQKPKADYTLKCYSYHCPFTTDGDTRICFRFARPWESSVHTSSLPIAYVTGRAGRWCAPPSHTIAVGSRPERYYTLPHMSSTYAGGQIQICPPVPGGRCQSWSMKGKGRKDGRIWVNVGKGENRWKDL